MAGGFLSVQLLCNTAPESVLPPVDHGDVPSPLGVLDAVWWSAVCDLDAAMLRKFCHAVRGLQVESLATPPASFPLDLGYDGCLLGHHWYGDGVFDVDDWGRRVRPSVARPERTWESPQPGLVHLVVRFLPLREVVRLSLLCMEWRTALAGLLRPKRPWSPKR